MSRTTNRNRKSTQTTNNQSTRRFAPAEPLEPRRMFDAAAPMAAADTETNTMDVVPVAGPMVLHAEFDQKSAPHEIRVTFSTDVWASLDGSDLALVNELGRFIIPSDVITVNWDATTNTASFIFVRLENGGVLPEGRWRATLLSEGIQDELGNNLDGDGDFLPGGNFNFDFHFLRGDANQDGSVDALDYSLMAANFGQSGRNFNQGDFDYDNRVGLSDLNLIAARFGTRIGGSTPNSDPFLGTTKIGDETTLF